MNSSRLNVINYEEILFDSIWSIASALRSSPKVEESVATCSLALQEATDTPSSKLMRDYLAVAELASGPRSL